jgi:flagellar biogenesis protein FliO
MNGTFTPLKNNKFQKENEAEGICPRCVLSLFVMLGLIAFVIWLVFLKN